MQARGTCPLVIAYPTDTAAQVQVQGQTQSSLSPLFPTMNHQPLAATSSQREMQHTLSSS